MLVPNSPFRTSVTAMADQSIPQGAIEIQTIDRNDEPVEQERENKPKRPPSWDDYSQEQLSEEVDEQSILDYEFNQCISW